MVPVSRKSAMLSASTDVSERCGSPDVLLALDLSNSMTSAMLRTPFTLLMEASSVAVVFGQNSPPENRDNVDLVVVNPETTDEEVSTDVCPMEKTSEVIPDVLHLHEGRDRSVVPDPLPTVIIPSLLRIPDLGVVQLATLVDNSMKSYLMSNLCFRQFLFVLFSTIEMM